MSGGFIKRDFDEAQRLLTENANAYAILDNYPVSPGHALIIPRRKAATIDELTEKEQIACFQLVLETKKILSEQYLPDGFNVGFNEGIAAGQSVEQLHIHIIPRYEGDVKDPFGGVRNIIPGSGRYA